MNITRIAMQRWNPNDEQRYPNLREFDNVKLVALETCPTWGIVRYEHHKLYKSPKRMMALEVGLACHQAFSSVRLGDLYHNGAEFYNDDEDYQTVAMVRMAQLFGEERAVKWRECMDSGEDVERAIMLGALEVFASSGFYDDPDDKKRTTPNIEEALIVYVTRYPLGKMMPVVAHLHDHIPFVGVEIPVNMLLEIEADGVVHRFRFTGRVDGIHWRDATRTELSIEDDKTASRLDDAWRMAWAISHQMTGYCLAAGALLVQPVMRGVVRGLAIPVPKTYDYGGCVAEPFFRNEQNFTEWAQWVIHVASTTAPYIDTPENAPKFTHSCNRYFRPCPLIPFCDSDQDERLLMLEEMDTEKWSPLDDTSE